MRERIEINLNRFPPASGVPSMFFTCSRDGRAVPLLIVGFGVVSIFASSLSAQTTPSASPPAPKLEASPKAEAELPAARSIIDRHIKAVGGREAILSHTSHHATGTFSVPAQGLVGTVEI